MDDNSLRVLEFSKVLEHLGGYCVTRRGRREALGLRPSTEVDTVALRLRETTQMKGFLGDENRLPLGGIHDLAPVLRSLHERGRPLDEEEILRFRSTLEAGRSLRESLLGLDAELDALRALGEGVPELDSLLARFEFTVDRRGRIRDEASARLLSLRKEIRDQELLIETLLRRIVASPGVRVHLRERKYFYRNGRFVLPVKAQSRGAVRGIIHDSSQSGQTVFIEPEDIVALGNTLGDLRAQERREVSRILWELTRDTLDAEGGLRELLDALGRIDLTCAKARYSLEYCLEPACLDASGLMLRRTFHPVLQILRRGGAGAVERAGGVVPIDVHLGDEFDLLIITGPNTGGKTVTLKTVGLVALMNQAGLHVPAAPGSRLPVFRAVHADIGDEQSLEQSLSTFSAHMANICRILRGAGPEALVLLDELGAGTDPAEGAALGVGILDFLVSRRARALVTTHIGSLKSYAYRNGRAANASVEFDVETLAPTFRLAIGRPGNSNAVTIARRIGMPEAVLERAEGILEGERDGSEDLVRRLEEALKAAEGKKMQSEGLREESLRIKESCERLRRELEERRRSVERDADAEVDEVLRAVRQRLEPPLRALRRAPSPFDETVRELVRAIEEGLRGTPLARKREAFARKLRKEDWVYIPRFRQKGRVKRVSRERRVVEVFVGRLAFEVPFEDVTWVEP